MPSLKDYVHHPDREKRERARQVRREKVAKGKLSEAQALRDKVLTSQLQRLSADQPALRAPSILDNVTLNVTAGRELISVTYQPERGGTLTVAPGCWTRVWRGTADCASI
jgi:hypothetical protein